MEFSWPMLLHFLLLLILKIKRLLTELIRSLFREAFDVSYTSTAEIEYFLGFPLPFLEIQEPILSNFLMIMFLHNQACEGLMRLSLIHI